MALEDSYTGTTYPESDMPSSYSITSSSSLVDASQDKNGYSKTWNQFLSYSPAVNAAKAGLSGSYRQPFASATNVSKWYLPAAGEWADAFEKLFFGSRTIVPAGVDDWSGTCYPDAIETVTGGPMSQWYWTVSTHMWSWVGFGINGSNGYTDMESSMTPGSSTMPTALSVRSFIHF